MTTPASNTVRETPAAGQIYLPMAVEDSECLVCVCEEFSRAPLFPVRPTGHPVVFHGTDPQLGSYEMHLGAVDKISPNDKGPDTCPSLCIEHALLLLVHIHLWGRRPQFEEPSSPYSPSFRQMWYLYSGSHRPPSSQFPRFKQLLRDLDDCRFRIVLPNQESTTHNLIESDIEHVRTPCGMLAGSRYANIRLHPLFVRTVLYSPATRDVDLTTLRGVSSKYARTLALWLPSRAARSEEANPFTISSAKLWAQMGLPGASRAARYNGLLKTRMIQDLDGLPMLGGAIMRVRLARGVEDFMLQAWKESCSVPKPSPVPDGPLMRAIRKSGRNSDDYTRSVKSREPLDAYEVDLIEKAGVRDLERSRAFYEICRGILGPLVFHEVLSDGKDFHLTGGEARESFGRRLRAALLNRIEKPVR